MEQELTQNQITRQNIVDNAILDLINELNPNLRRIEWDIDIIGSVRDAIQTVLVDKLHVTTEQEFYPFIDESDDDELFESEISIVWDKDDIKQQARNRGWEITDKQCSDILKSLKKNHDCNYGITWESIDYFILELIEKNELTRAKVYNISFYERPDTVEDEVSEDCDFIDETQLDTEPIEGNDEWVWDLFKEFGHERTSNTFYEVEERDATDDE